jgi:hypothetical protein
MEHPVPNPPESEAARHEVRDVAPCPILIFVVSLLVTLVVVHYAGWVALRWLEDRQLAQNRIAFPANPFLQAMGQVPPDPRLEPEPSRDVLPHADLVAVRAREQAMIGDNAWGWVDSAHQFARIPIQQAMNLAVEHGLPDVLPATQPAEGPFAPPASALHGPGGVP